MARILLIDDDDLFRSMLCEALKHFGHTVFVACNGAEGLALFRKLTVDLVITDLVMPEKEGFEVLMGIRKVNSSIGIIAISGGLRGRPNEFLRMAQHLGATKVLSKPFSNEALINTINEILPSSEGSLELAPAS
jgi:DNA-binding response OmpR family regulator